MINTMILSVILTTLFPCPSTAFISYMTCSDVQAFYDECLQPVPHGSRCREFDPSKVAAPEGTVNNLCNERAEHLLYFQTDEELLACDYSDSPLENSLAELTEFKTTCRGELDEDVVGPCFTLFKFQEECLREDDTDCGFDNCRRGLTDLSSSASSSSSSSSSSPPSSWKTEDGEQQQQQDCRFTTKAPELFCELGAEEIVELLEASPPELKESCAATVDLNAFDDLIESCGALYDVAEAMAADVAPLVVNMDCTDLSSFADSCVFLGNPQCEKYDPSTLPHWTEEQESLDEDEWKCRFQAEHVTFFVGDSTSRRCPEAELSSGNALDVERFQYQCGRGYDGPCNFIAKFAELCLQGGDNSDGDGGNATAHLLSDDVSPEDFCKDVLLTTGGGGGGGSSGGGASRNDDDLSTYYDDDLYYSYDDAEGFNGGDTSGGASSAMNCAGAARLVLALEPEQTAACADLAVVNFEVFEKYANECGDFAPPSPAPTAFLDGPRGGYCDALRLFQDVCIPEGIDDDEMDLICEEFYWYKQVPGLSTTLSCSDLSVSILSIPNDDFLMCEAALTASSPATAAALMQFRVECKRYENHPPPGPCDLLEDLVDECIDGWFEATAKDPNHVTDEEMLKLCDIYYGENSRDGSGGGGGKDDDYDALMEAAAYWMPEACEGLVAGRQVLFFELNDESYDYCLAHMDPTEAATMDAFTHACRGLYEETPKPSAAPTHAPSTAPSTVREGLDGGGGVDDDDNDGANDGAVSSSNVTITVVILSVWFIIICAFAGARRKGIPRKCAKGVKAFCEQSRYSRRGGKFQKLEEDHDDDMYQGDEEDDIGSPHHDNPGENSLRDFTDDEGDEQDNDDDDDQGVYADDGFVCGEDDDEDDVGGDTYDEGFDNGERGMELRPIPRSYNFS